MAKGEGVVARSRSTNDIAIARRRTARQRRLLRDKHKACSHQDDTQRSNEVANAFSETIHLRLLWHLAD
jgi:hypothetical protein